MCAFNSRELFYFLCIYVASYNDTDGYSNNARISLIPVDMGHSTMLESPSCCVWVSCVDLPLLLPFWSLLVDSCVLLLDLW